MEGRYVYVLSKKERDKMIEHGYELIRSNEFCGVYIFENREDIEVMSFNSDDDIHCIVTNMLIF